MSGYNSSSARINEIIIKEVYEQLQKMDRWNKRVGKLLKESREQRKKFLEELDVEYEVWKKEWKEKYDYQPPANIKRAIVFLDQKIDEFRTESFVLFQNECLELYKQDIRKSGDR